MLGPTRIAGRPSKRLDRTEGQRYADRGQDFTPEDDADRRFVRLKDAFDRAADAGDLDAADDLWESLCRLRPALRKKSA